MKTELLSTDEASLKRAAELLEQHQPVAFPTETVYGLGAKVFDRPAIQRIYELKGRPSDNPLIVHIGDLSQIQLVADHLPASFEKLAARFMPGPLTVVLHRNRAVPAEVSAGLDTVAVRMPNHPVALQLIKVAGEPLVAPSANLSGKPSPTTAAHVWSDLHDQVAAIIDAGATEIGIESTVIDVTTPQPIILRPGSITPEQLSQVLGQPVKVAPPTLSKRVASPGMKYRHYAPTAQVTVYGDWDSFLTDVTPAEAPTTLVLTNQPIPNQTPPLIVHSLKAQTLFAEFREADRLGLAQIAIVLDDTSRQHLGLMNRITKAALKN